MKTITSPKRLRADQAEEFRLAILALGGRWNNTYNYWMLDDDKAAEADALRAKYPDQPFEKAPNQFCLDKP